MRLVEVIPETSEPSNQGIQSRPFSYPYGGSTKIKAPANRHSESFQMSAAGYHFRWVSAITFPREKVLMIRVKINQQSRACLPGDTESATVDFPRQDCSTQVPRPTEPSSSPGIGLCLSCVNPRVVLAVVEQHKRDRAASLHRLLMKQFRAKNRHHS